MRPANRMVVTVIGMWSAAAAWGAGGGMPSIAQVPPELGTTEAYTIYARTLIQIDLLANPQTASLPLVATAFRPGSILLEGKVPSARMREYLVANARRISGLSVESHLEIVETPSEPLVKADPRNLEAEIEATIAGFYPELASDIRATVTKDGVAELNGQITSYEAKLNLSRLVKSQQGCRAVVNLVRVPADPARGEIRVTEDGGLRLEANRLPLIPAAPLTELLPAKEGNPKLRNSAPVLADDAPAADAAGARFIEDAQAIIGRDPELALLNLEVTYENSGLVITAKLDSREQVEKVIEGLSEIPSLSKILVKSRPYSIQRTIPPARVESRDEEQKDWTDRVKRMIPWTNDGSPESLARSWRFRESLRRNLTKLGGPRVQEVSVKTSTRGLLIEADVTSARDRAFFLKQVDNLVETRNMAMDVVLRIKDAGE